MYPDSSVCAPSISYIYSMELGEDSSRFGNNHSSTAEESVHRGKYQLLKSPDIARHRPTRKLTTMSSSAEFTTGDLFFNTKHKRERSDGEKRMCLQAQCHQVTVLASAIFAAQVQHLPPVLIGGYNVVYRLRVAGRASDVMVRLPIPNCVQFPEEKVNREAATALFVARHTEIPVPGVLFHGVDPVLGPFVMMEPVEHSRDADMMLRSDYDDLSLPSILDGELPEEKLIQVWSQIAECKLRLLKPRFPRIGSLTKAADDSIDVLGRPLTMNMTELIWRANIPRAVLPPESKTYETADEWYTALAEMHIAQLLFQQNDAVESPDDCRNKYVARMLFRRLAKQGKLSSYGYREDCWSAEAQTGPRTCPMPSGEDSFRLWGDDFRPGNILLKESDDVAAYIDWEFTYAAPTQFSLDPPCGSSSLALTCGPMG